MQFIPVLALFNSYITAAIAATATSCVLNSVTSIPTAPFHAILDAGTDKAEVVKVTAVTTATKTLTIVRAQGGTTGVAHAADTLFHACEIGSVNLHLDAMAVTLAGSSELAALSLTVTDTTTIASGYNKGIYLSYTSSGAKTGGTVNGIAIDFVWSANLVLANGIDIYLAASGTRTADTIVGIHIYMDDPSTGISAGAYYGIRLQLYCGRAAVDGFISLRDIGSGGANWVMQWESAAMAYYFINQDTAGIPFVGGSHTSVHGYLRCNIGGVCYIPLFT